MGFWLKLLFISFLAVVIPTLLMLDVGYMDIHWQRWRIETSVTVILGLFLFTILVAIIATEAVRFLWQLPTRWQEKRHLKLHIRSELALSKALATQHMGQLSKAEKMLQRSAKHSEGGLVHLLQAAQLAHQQQAFDRRDQYIHQAKSDYPKDALTTSLIQAKLLTDSDPEQAIDLLYRILEFQANFPPALALLFENYVTTQRWQDLESLSPTVLRHKALSEAEVLPVWIQASRQRIQSCDHGEACRHIWQNLDKRLKQDSDLCADYVEKRLQFNQVDGLVPFVEKQLQRHWNGRLITAYRYIPDNANVLLKHAKLWQSAHPNDENLLLTLAYLSARVELWGQALEFARQVLSQHFSKLAVDIMIQCHQAMGNPQTVAEIYLESYQYLPEHNQLPFHQNLLQTPLTNGSAQIIAKQMDDDPTPNIS